MAYTPTEDEREVTRGNVLEYALGMLPEELGPDETQWASKLKQSVKAYNHRWFRGWTSSASYKACKRAIKYRKFGPSKLGRPPTLTIKTNIKYVTKILTKRPGLSVGDVVTKLATKV